MKLIVDDYIVFDPVSGAVKFLRGADTLIFEDGSDCAQAPIGLGENEYIAITLMVAKLNNLGGVKKIPNRNSNIWFQLKG